MTRQVLVIAITILDDILSMLLLLLLLCRLKTGIKSRDIIEIESDQLVVFVIKSSRVLFALVLTL